MPEGRHAWPKAGPTARGGGGGAAKLLGSIALRYTGLDCGAAVNLDRSGEYSMGGPACSESLFKIVRLEIPPRPLPLVWALIPEPNRPPSISLRRILESLICPLSPWNGLLT